MDTTLIGSLTTEERERLLKVADSLNFRRKPTGVPPILPAPPGQRLPLSFAQQRLWFLSQMEGVSEAYHIPFALRLKGSLDAAVLRRAVDRIVARHEALRTTFALFDREPVQRIAPAEESRFHLLEHDVRGHIDPEAELRRLAEEEARAPFNLETGPLVRGRLIRLPDDEHALLFTMHHIVSDGWSVAVFNRELSALYSAFLRHEADPLAGLKIQYADYAIWQRQWLQGSLLEREAEYWKKALAGAPALLELAADHPRPAIADHVGAFFQVELDESLTASLKQLSHRNGTTMFMTLLAGWAAMLARLSDQRDVIIGTPTANRGRVEIEDLIGFFVNTLVLRLDLSGSPSVADLLRQARTQALAAQQHQDIPFEQVVEVVQPVRTLAHNSLFQTMFVWQNNEEETLVLPGFAVSALPPLSHRTAKFDMTLILRETEGKIAGGIEYAISLFEQATIERYAGYFRNLLKAMACDDTQTVDRLPLLDAAERHRLLYDWNATRSDFPENACIHHLFEDQVERTPDVTAVEMEGSSLTYRQLDERANQLAHHLVSLGVGPEVLVGVCLERSLNMVVAILAILKAGGAYVPLDPSFPQVRLSQMVEDSRMQVLLTHRGMEQQLQVVPPAIVRLDADRAEIEEWSNDASGLPRPQSGSRAYVLYTSGSTGKPKGVEIPHSAVVNFLLSMQREPGFHASDTLLAVTTLSFDIAGLEIYLPLITGGRVVIARRETTLDPLRLMIRMRDCGCTVMQATPATWRGLVQAGWKGSPNLKILCGGEALTRDLAEELLSRCGELWNMYGPTETTIWSTVHRVRPGAGAVPIGRPIANTQLFVLNENRDLVPQGASGELYIGGEGLARGYLHREELTRERFVPNPFIPGARMYRTGDLARWLSDGTLECLGRVDNQVKLRGYRIELGEIEARLGEHPAVRQAVVIAREDTPGDKRLVAYYTSELKDEAVGAEQFRSHLAASLPEYMVPAAFVRLQALPLTPNGKLDRKALPPPEAEAFSTRHYEPPQGEMEENLAEIWADVLNLDRVGRHDDFFELGGHSLLAVQLALRIQNILPGESLPLRAVLEAPTVAGLANWIQDRKGNRFEFLAQIKPGTAARAPFFCVHASDGNPLGMQPLAKALSADLPFYSLEHKGLDGRAPFETVEDAARSFLDEVRQVQPHGPYHLGGYCFGGVVAFEMARMLEKLGEPVGGLFLIDGYNPAFRRFQPTRDLFLRVAAFHLRRAAIHSRKMMKLRLGEWMKYGGGRFKALCTHTSRIVRAITAPDAQTFPSAAPETVTAPADLDLEQILDRARQAGPLAARNFVPKPYCGSAVIFRTKERGDSPFEDPFLGWKSLVRGRIESFEIEGDHKSIFYDPVLVRPIAEIIDARLRECSAGSGETALASVHAEVC